VSVSILIVCYLTRQSSIASGDSDLAKLLVVPLCEILWRYCLIATTDQEPALKLIHNCIGDLAYMCGDYIKHLDLEDSRIVLCAYNARLAPALPDKYQPLDVSALPVLLEFVVALAQTGTEDLLPSLFGRTIRRIWDDLVKEEHGAEFYVKNIQNAFQAFT
jgi:hypothetical protein